MRRSPAAALAVVLVLGPIACGGDDGPARLTAGDGFSVEDALAELPVPPDDDGSPIAVEVVDLEAASTANGVERPAADADPDEVQEWWTALTIPEDDEALPVPVMPFDAFGLGRVPADELFASFGISPAAIDALTEVSAPPYVFGVAQGELEEDDLADADLDGSGGTYSLGSGEDLEANPDDASAARPTGAPIRLAADGDRIASSTTTEEVEAWRDGEARTLADEDDLRRVAAAIDEADPVAAVLMTADFSEPGPTETEAQSEAVDELISIEAEFTAAGAGYAVFDDEAVVTVAYAFADDDAAEAAVDQVEAAYAEGRSLVSGEPIADRLDVTEVEAAGSVVVATLAVVDGSPGVVTTMLSTRDVPFTYR